MNDVGKATHPSGDHPICDTQRGENHQAQDTPMVWDANPPLAWSRAIPYIGLLSVALVLVCVPGNLGYGIAAGLAIVTALGTWWAR